MDDLGQDAALRFLRAERNGGIRHTEGLASDIARKTAIDFVRRKKRWRAILCRSAGPAEESTDIEPREPVGDSVERLRFLLLEFCRGRSLEWYQLAKVRLDGLESWKEVAEQTGTSHAAIRQRWSRCIAEFRAWALEDPELPDWIKESLRR